MEGLASKPKITRCASKRSTATAAHSLSISYRCTRKSTRLLLTGINANLIFPDVTCLSGDTYREPRQHQDRADRVSNLQNLGRRQNQDRVKSRRLSSTVPGFSHPDCYSGISQSCRSIHTPSSLSRTHPNGKRFQLLVLVRA